MFFLVVVFCLFVCLFACLFAFVLFFSFLLFFSIASVTMWKHFLASLSRTLTIFESMV